MRTSHTCNWCNKNKVKIFGMPCSSCKQRPSYKRWVKQKKVDSNRIKNRAGFLGEGQRVASISHDTKGRPVALNSKGQEVHNSYSCDPRGYKRAGKKKIASKDQHGNATGY